MSEKADFITRYRYATAILVSALQQIEAMNNEYERAGYGSALIDDDFAGSDILDRSTFINTVTTTNNILSGIDNPNWTNLYKTRGR
jgi:hypothetical protein